MTTQEPVLRNRNSLDSVTNATHDLFPESRDVERESAWHIEIERRLKALENGTMKCYTV